MLPDRTAASASARGAGRTAEPAERRGRQVLPPLLTGPLRLFLCGCALVALALWRFAVPEPGENLDDAFILLVYAKHLAQGGPLYYNLAQGRLDGFTSPLDLFIKALVIRLFPGDPVLDIWVVSLGYYLAVVVSLFGLAGRAARRCGRAVGGVPLLVAAIGASSQSLAAGSQFLLETPLYTLLGVWAGYYFLVDSPPRSWPALLAFAGLLAALPLARPEGLVVAAACLFGFFIIQRRRLGWLRLCAPAVGFALAVGAYYVWRLRYFGFWAPNTYYAKTSASRLNELKDGLRYLWSYTFSSGLPVMLWLFLSPALLPRLPTAELRQRYGALCAVMLAALLAVIYGGGDCYPGGRFLALPVTLSTLALLLVGLHGPARAERLLPVGGARGQGDRGWLALMLRRAFGRVLGPRLGG